MTPEQRVTQAVQHEHGCLREVDMRGSAYCARHAYGWLSVDRCPHAEAAAIAALVAVREALASDDPKVVRAMAERVGLSVTFRSVPGWPVRGRVKVCFRTRWMEASDANS